jgi:hypothetical protein
MDLDLDIIVDELRGSCESVGKNDSCVSTHCTTNIHTETSIDTHIQSTVVGRSDDMSRGKPSEGRLKAGVQGRNLGGVAQ